jgi:hypothetical protein
MSPGRTRTHAEQVVSALRNQEERDRFTRSRQALKQHLIHKREVPNGRDFLFLGPAEELHEALRSLRDLESHCTRFLEFDYAQIEGYFLLRIVGLPQYLETIDAYFD